MLPRPRTFSDVCHHRIAELFGVNSRREEHFCLCVNLPSKLLSTLICIFHIDTPMPSGTMSGSAKAGPRLQRRSSRGRAVYVKNLVGN